MGLIGNGKSDVKNHFSSHRRKHLHLASSNSQPDATGFSGGEVDGAEAPAPDPAASPLRPIVTGATLIDAPTHADTRVSRTPLM